MNKNFLLPLIGAIIIVAIGLTFYTIAINALCDQCLFNLIKCN